MDTIHAAYHTEFDDVLRRLNLLEPDGSIKPVHCHFCRQVVSKDNISSVFPENGKTHVCCDRISCKDALMELTAASSFQL